MTERYQRLLSKRPEETKDSYQQAAARARDKAQRVFHLIDFMITFASKMKQEMQIRLTAPHDIRSRIVLPSSKSISNRALIMGALAGDTKDIDNVSHCDDTRVMIKALTERGQVIDIMAAGTAMRFLTAYFAIQQGETHTLTGTARMKQRPIRLLVDALRTLGADIEYAGHEGYPPLLVHGKELAEAARTTLPGNVSSQYISALMMIGPALPHGLCIELQGEVVSRPYIELTLKLMADFGAKAEWTADGTALHIHPGGYRPTHFSVESDWSAASYWYAFAAMEEEACISLPLLQAASYQGDSAVAQLFEPLGVKTSFEDGGAVLTRVERTCTRMEYDFVNQPDLAQTFVVTCAMLGIPFRFGGLQSLKIKETDRMAALIRELGKLGFVIRETGGDTLSWDGERTHELPDAAIDTYEDHRMAMAFSIASFRFPGLRINHPEVVSKSYPLFWDDLRQAGFSVEEA